MPVGAYMRTVDERLVRAPAETIFALAADVERWPLLLKHYRYVRFHERMHGTGIVEMSATRPFGLISWPTWWTSIMQIQHPAGASQPVVRFRHIAGITRGMEVEWSFVPVTDGTQVTVLHLWNGPSWPVIGRVAARRVIGPVFVHGIASRTLEGLARAAEHGQTSARAFTRE
jgi:ribosome-associated toxin RatA of RatAB toxin-antitoxin module